MSAHMANSRPSWVPVQVKPKIPSIVIPTTTHVHEVVLGNSLTNTWTPVSPILIPPRVAPTSSSPRVDSHSNSPLKELTASDITSPNLIAIAELFAAMKCTFRALGTTFENLGKQTEKMASLAPAVKASEQINNTRAELQEQIRRQEASMQTIYVLLENAIQDSVVDRLREQIFTEIQDTVANEVKERVQRELAKLIPTYLHPQVQNRTKESSVVQTSLCNREAQTYNANLQPTSSLRPLLRPLPTPQQSPTYVVRRAPLPITPLDPTPLSAFPRLKVPAPTPITTFSQYLLIPGGSNQYIQVTPPTPSPTLPRDLKSLFALDPDMTQRLLQDYSSDNKDEYLPANDDPRPKAVPRGSIPDFSFGPLFNSDNYDHTENKIRRFMFHIGVRALSYFILTF
ncbi:hypothetical protein BDZ94DRAFT_1274442 [Collybia nuda]|uniref:Uncharacterized protein n=1 Tax=Collybia nuda TaxID=64659 RepID=A0A9P5XWP1_9AGAR|nr:hypothetical protein BDZ94DRAFT_1274442 [Collybia nuda]